RKDPVRRPRSLIAGESSRRRRAALAHAAKRAIRRAARASTIYNARVSLRLGPILGEVAPDGVEVWFEVGGEGPWLLHLASDRAMRRPVPGSPWPAMRLARDSDAWIAEARLPRPGETYTYDVRAGDGRSLLPAGLSARTFRAAPAPDSREGFSFAFASCHGPFTWRAARTRYRMWRRPDALPAHEGVRVLMPVGAHNHRGD